MPPPPLMPPLGGGIAVEPGPAQPAIKSEETAIATPTRAIAVVLLAVFVVFIIVGLTDI